jgi:hypothetical protein
MHGYIAGTDGDDINKAINVCKKVIMAVRYVRTYLIVCSPSAPMC